MKKVFLSTAVIAIACAFTFTSCKKDDATKDDATKDDVIQDDVIAPKITLPTDATVPVFQLGDTEAALKDVTAKDNIDGDVTANISVDGIQYVADNAILMYSVSDEAGNIATAQRVATVSAEKLFGSYTVSEIDDDLGGDPETYNVTVNESASGKGALVINNLYDNNWTIVLKGTKNVATLEAEPLNITLGGGKNGTITGTATYSNDGTYKLLTFKYKISFTGEEPMNYTATFTKR